MLSKILHWIYCLPIERAVILALLATGIFFWGYRRWSKTPWWKAAVGIVLICWAVVAFNVMFAREYGVRQLSLIPFRSYATTIANSDREPIRSDFMNVLLFYPGGLLLMSLIPRKQRPKVLLGFFLLSVAVEVGQYVLSVGVTETDDVIHNTLGTALGWLSLRQYEKYNADGP